MLDGLVPPTQGTCSHTEIAPMFHARIRTFRPRHPLARLLLGLVGVAVALVLVAIGFFAVVALAIGGALLLLAKSLRPQPRDPGQPASPAPTGVIEGEYSIVDGPGTPVRTQSHPF
jgi:hypothetical protein